MNAIPPRTASIATTADASSRTLQQVLSNVTKGGLGDSLGAVSPMAGCLLPLLDALQWRGTSLDVAEALPHHVEDLSIAAFRNTMAYLGYGSRTVTARLSGLEPRLCPCLFVRDAADAAAAPLVILEADATHLRVYDPEAGETRQIKRTRARGEVYLFRPLEDPAAADGPPGSSQRTWFGRLTRRFGKQFRNLLLVSFLLNVLALATPLFILALYDQVIPTGAIPTLAALAIGVFAALGFELAFRVIRSNALAWVGGRIDFLVGSAVFRRLLNLSPSQTESAPLGAQISRLKELHAIRAAFTGPMCMALLDLPFVLLFLVVIFLVAGWLVVVPIVTILVLVGAAIPLRWRLRRLLDDGMRSSADHQAFLVETASKVRAIRYHGMEDVWAARHRDISAQSAIGSWRLTRFAGRIEIMADILKLVSGLGTLAVGILLVLDGHVSVGGLIASMALMWRALSPLQTLFLSAVKLEQTRRSIQSINGLMRLPSERNRRAHGTRRQHSGRIAMRHVGFRFRADRDPAVHNITLDIQPGEIVAIAGASGAGKSTVLKLLLGMYAPQVGAVLIDGLDLRQLEPVQYRQGVSYMPQTYQMFHGTIAQNLRLAHPSASLVDLERAAEEANVLDDIRRLPDGFESWLNSDGLKYMPNGLRHRLCLARAFVRPSNILLLDEPGSALDHEGDKALCAAIERRRGHCSIIMTTHRPSHMRLADRLIALDQGQIRAAGTPDEVLPLLMRARA